MMLTLVLSETQTDAEQVAEQCMEREDRRKSSQKDSANFKQQ